MYLILKWHIDLMQTYFIHQVNNYKNDWDFWPFPLIQIMASKCRRILALRGKEESNFREARSRARNRRLFSNRSLSLSSRVDRSEPETIFEESPLAGKRSRSLASLVKGTSRRSVHNLVRMFETVSIKNLKLIFMKYLKLCFY